MIRLRWQAGAYSVKAEWWIGDREITNEQVRYEVVDGYGKLMELLK
jgi:hypothetical protein